MTRPSPDTERLLLAAATGEISEQDERVRRLLIEHPELEARLSELKVLTDRLDAGAAFQDEILESADRFVGASGEDRVEAIIRAELENDIPRPVPREPGRRWPRALLLGAALAAAALFLVFGTSLFEPEPEPKQEQILGRFRITALSVSEGVFTWQSKLSSDTSFEVVIARDETGSPPSEIGRYSGIIEQRFEPSEETIAEWPRNIVWRVIGYDSNAVEQGTSDWASWSSR